LFEWVASESVGGKEKGKMKRKAPVKNMVLFKLFTKILSFLSLPEVYFIYVFKLFRIDIANLKCLFVLFVPERAKEKTFSYFFKLFSEIVIAL